MEDLASSSNIIPFIDVALEAGVRMFVYLSATIADSKQNSGGLGKIPKFLEDTVAQGRYKDLDYVILRPTWFIGKGLFASVVKSAHLPICRQPDN